MQGKNNEEIKIKNQRTNGTKRNETKRNIRKSYRVWTRRDRLMKEKPKWKSKWEREKHTHTRNLLWVHIPCRWKLEFFSICINYTRKTWHCGNKLIKLFDFHTHTHTHTHSYSHSHKWVQTHIEMYLGFFMHTLISLYDMHYHTHSIQHCIKTRMDTECEKKRDATTREHANETF